MAASPEPQQSSGFLGTLKSKWGPLPVWGWLLIVTALAVGYYLWSRRKGAQQQQKTAPITGQPGVVVINQGEPEPAMPPPVKPPKPPEDHDKDEDGKSRGHDDDDHHRHRRHRRDRDRDRDTMAGAPQPAVMSPPATPVPQQPGDVDQVNVGALFPKIGPAPVAGGGRRRAP